MKWVIYRQEIKTNSSIGIDHWPIGQEKYVKEKKLYEIHSKFVRSIVRLNLKRWVIFFEDFDQLNYHLKINRMSIKSTKNFLKRTQSANIFLI
jgi:hypothetical protein